VKAAEWLVEDFGSSRPARLLCDTRMEKDAPEDASRLIRPARLPVAFSRLEDGQQEYRDNSSAEEVAGERSSRSPT
jgi:hypothetical protein